MEALKGRPMAYHLPATTKIVFIDSIPILTYERNVLLCIVNISSIHPQRISLGLGL